MLCKMKRCGKEIPDDAIFCPYCGKAQKKDPKKPASRADGHQLLRQNRTGNTK